MTTPPMQVTFWGTRGSISTPGRATEKYGGNTPCVSIVCGDTNIVLDAGTGIRNLGLDLMRQSQRQRKNLKLHLLLSHTHWDHIQGLPFFVPAYLKGTHLTIYGSPKKEIFLESILQGQMDINYFPVPMNSLAADLSIIEFAKQKTKIGGLTVEWQEQVCHPGGSVRYRISSGQKKIVYATDVELDRMFGKTAHTRSNKELGRIYRRFIHGADLLIADGQYTSDEYAEKVGFGHTTIPMLLQIAVRESVKQLAVFHHDPQHSDTMIDLLWNQFTKLYGSKISLFWAREGLTIAV